MRALGVDYGRKRVGLAISDPTGTLATPLETLTRRAGKRPPVAALSRVAEREGVDHLVVGLPLELDGQENDWCREVREFGDSLAARLDLPLTFIDERLSSVRAEQAIRSAGGSRALHKDRGRIDAAAAAVILQCFLDGEAGR